MGMAITTERASLEKSQLNAGARSIEAVYRDEDGYPTFI